MIALVILAILSLLGAPFAASMLLRRKQSMRASSIAQLRNAAADLRNRAQSHLLATHEDEEAGAFDRAYPPAERPVPGPLSAWPGDPTRALGPTVRPQDTDSLEELSDADLILREEAASGLRLEAQGQLSDEQGKVDVSTASFLLLGNILGSSHLGRRAEAEDDRLTLVDASMFPTDGDPATRDGLLVIYDSRSGTFEAVTYRSRVGNELGGVRRGELLSIPAPHVEGSLIFDARALKLYLDRLWGTGRPFAALSGLRQVNTWSLVRFFADQLWHHHLSAEDVPRTHLLAELLGEASEEVSLEEVEEAERKLLQAGLSAELVDEAGRALGERALREIANALGEEGGKEAAQELEKELRSDRAGLKRGSKLLIESAGRVEELLAEEGLEALTASELERHRDLLTLHAQPPATWSPETACAGQARLGTFVLSARSSAYLGPGSIVRLQGLGGGGEELNLMSGDRPIVVGPYAGKRIGPCVLARRVSPGLAEAFRQGKALCSALLRSPVNVNTATYSVLVAVLKGVQLKSGEVRVAKEESPSEPVTEAQARRVADMIWGQLPIDDLGSLAGILREACRAGVIAQDQALALLVNAVNPLSSRLYLSTCGFTFATCETYGLSVLGVARRGPEYGRARELGRVLTYEVFKVAPPGILNLVWDSEADFSSAVNLPLVLADEVSAAEGSATPVADFWTLPLFGRSSHLVMTYGQGSSGMAWSFPTHGPGVLTGMPGRLAPPIRQALCENFDGRPEGEILTAGRSITFQVPMDPPYAIDFHLCPLWDSASGEILLASVTDGTLRHPGSTVTLSYDAGTNELLLKVLGGAKPDPGRWRNSAEVFVGVRAPLQKVLAPDTWYHLGFVVARPEPGGQAIFLDGRLVGHGNLAGTSQGRLAAGAAGGAFSLEDRDVADNLPASCPLWVGDEIVYVQGRRGNRFQIGPATEADDGETGRGCRGTPALSHERAPVRPVGYRVPLRPSIVGLDREALVAGAASLDWITAPDRFAIPALPLRNRPPSLELKRGGAGLAFALPKTLRTIGAMPADLELTRDAITLRRTEQTLLTSLGKDLRAVPYTYALIIVICNFEARPQVAGSGKGEAGPGGKESGRFYPIDANYLPVPLDPRQSGFAERGLLRIRYRFEPSTDILDPSVLRMTAQYDRIVEYAGIGKGDVPGDGSYHAFTGIRDISAGSFVYRGEDRVTAQDFTREGGALKQLRVYGISVSASGPALSQSYPPSGVIEIAAAGRSQAVFPQLRDVEWIRYNYIYRNYFVSSVENRIQEDRWTSDPARQARNSNNTVLRGFCGAVTRAGTGGLWAENFDPGAISNHPPGAEIKPVFWALSALPGAGDGVWLSPREEPEAAEFLRIHKKAETDQGVFISLSGRLKRDYGERDYPVIRHFPEPHFEAAAAQGQGEAGRESRRRGELTIGPSIEGEGGSLEAIVDEIRVSLGTGLLQGPAPFAARALGRGDGRFLPEEKGRQRISFFLLPHFDGTSSTIEASSGSKQGLEGLFALGKELLHLRRDENDSAAAGLRLTPSPFMFAPGDPRGAAGESAELAPPVFFKPWAVREVWPQIQVEWTAGRSTQQAGYAVVEGPAGREIWSFERASGNSLMNVRRGVLGSAVALPAINPGGARLSGYLVPFQTAEVVRGALMDSEPLPQELAHNFGTVAPQFHVADGAVAESGLRGPSWGIESGYVRVDDGQAGTLDRIVAFVNRGSLILDELSRRPVFTMTGCFGTVRGETVRGSLIYLPFRAYDRYMVAASTHHLQHFTRPVRRPGALWRRLSWEHGEWAAAARRRLGPEPQIRVLLRFDGRPAWHEEPANKPGGLYLFSDPVPKEGFPLDVAADEVELRILFFWPEGSYGGSAAGGFADTWKVAPRLRSIVLEYQDRSRVLHHEEFVR